MCFNHEKLTHCADVLLPACFDPDHGRIAGEESYLATDKGAINWGHVLVLPVEHYRSGLACPPSTAAEMGRYLAALRLCYKAQVCDLKPSALRPA